MNVPSNYYVSNDDDYAASAPQSSGNINTSTDPRRASYGQHGRTSSVISMDSVSYADESLCYSYDESLYMSDGTNTLASTSPARPAVFDGSLANLLPAYYEPGSTAEYGYSDPSSGHQHPHVVPASSSMGDPLSSTNNNNSGHFSSFDSSISGGNYSYDVSGEEEEREDEDMMFYNGNKAAAANTYQQNQHQHQQQPIADPFGVNRRRGTANGTDGSPGMLSCGFSSCSSSSEEDYGLTNTGGMGGGITNEEGQLPHANDREEDGDGGGGEEINRTMEDAILVDGLIPPPRLKRVSSEGSVNPTDGGMAAAAAAAVAASDPGVSSLHPALAAAATNLSTSTSGSSDVSFGSPPPQLDSIMPQSLRELLASTRGNNNSITSVDFAPSPCMTSASASPSICSSSDDEGGDGGGGEYPSDGGAQEGLTPDVAMSKREARRRLFNNNTADGEGGGQQHQHQHPPYLVPETVGGGGGGGPPSTVSSMPGPGPGPMGGAGGLGGLQRSFSGRSSGDGSFNSAPHPHRRNGDGAFPADAVLRRTASSRSSDASASSSSFASSSSNGIGGGADRFLRRTLSSKSSDAVAGGIGGGGGGGGVGAIGSSSSSVASSSTSARVDRAFSETLRTFSRDSADGDSTMGGGSVSSNQSGGRRTAFADTALARKLSKRDSPSRRKNRRGSMSSFGSFGGGGGANSDASGGGGAPVSPGRRRGAAGGGGSARSLPNRVVPTSPERRPNNGGYGNNNDRLVTDLPSPMPLSAYHRDVSSASMGTANDVGDDGTMVAPSSSSPPTGNVAMLGGSPGGGDVSSTSSCSPQLQLTGSASSSPQLRLRMEDGGGGDRSSPPPKRTEGEAIAEAEDGDDVAMTMMGSDDAAPRSDGDPFSADSSGIDDARPRSSSAAVPSGGEIGKALVPWEPTFADDAAGDTNKSSDSALVPWEPTFPDVMVVVSSDEAATMTAAAGSSALVPAQTTTTTKATSPAKTENGSIGEAVSDGHGDGHGEGDGAGDGVVAPPPTLEDLESSFFSSGSFAASEDDNAPSREKDGGGGGGVGVGGAEEDSPGGIASSPPHQENRDPNMFPPSMSRHTTTTTADSSPESRALVPLGKSKQSGVWSVGPTLPPKDIDPSSAVVPAAPRQKRALSIASASAEAVAVASPVKTSAEGITDDEAGMALVGSPPTDQSCHAVNTGSEVATNGGRSNNDGTKDPVVPGNADSPVSAQGKAKDKDDNFRGRADNEFIMDGVPNLHRDLANGAWGALDRHLSRLAKRNNPQLLFAALTATTAEPPADGMEKATKSPSSLSPSSSSSNGNNGNNNSSTGCSTGVVGGYGATPLHTACWKAPPSVALHMISLLPALGYNVARVCHAADSDGNTALHLCAGNTCMSSVSTDGSRMEIVVDDDGEDDTEDDDANNGGGNDENEPNGTGRSRHRDSQRRKKKPRRQGGQKKKREERKMEMDVLLALIRASPKALRMQNNEGDTPLHMAVSTPLASAEAVRTIIRAATGADGEDDGDGGGSAAPPPHTSLRDDAPLLIQDSAGQTPLHSAIANGANLEVLNALLDAAPRAAHATDKRGMTPLHYVAAFSHTPMEFVEKLLGINPNAVLRRTVDGDTPLHLAIANNTQSESTLKKQTVRALLRQQTGGFLRGEDILNDSNVSNSSGGDDTMSPLLIANKEKLNPLHCCALFDAPPHLTKLLMKHPDATRAACMTNTFGATPLHIAVSQPGVAQSLATTMALGTPDAAAVQDRLKRTPLHVAAQNVHSTSLLIQSLAQLHPGAASTMAQRGHLPLHMAAQSQASEPVVRALLRSFPGAAEARNKSSNTPLHDAAKYKASAGVVRLLLDTYPDAIHIQNQYGNLPLHCATAYKANSDVIQLLLKAWPEGASTQNRNQDAPLHYAAAYTSEVGVIQSLLAAAPRSVSLVNSSGQSPVDRASSNNAPLEIITMLENAAAGLPQEEEQQEEAGDGGWAAFDTASF